MKLKDLFKRPEHYTKPSASMSPAEKASHKWDEREGEIIEQNYNLRRLLIGMMLVIVALGGALCYKSVSENYLVYVVETDIKTGEVRNVGTVSRMENYTPNDQVYAYFIRQFVMDTRNIPLDEVVYKNQLRNAFGFLTKDGATILDSRLRAENRQIGRETVQISITSLIPMEGGKSYQVRWNEVKYTTGQGGKKVTPYTGVFTTEIIKSEDKEQLAVNPLGLYISDFRWEQDSEGTKANTNSNTNGMANNQPNNNGAVTAVPSN